MKSSRKRRRWPSFIRIWTATCLLIILSVPASAQDSRSFTPAEIKAGLIGNCLKFTQWPSEAFASADSPFVIGVLGQDPVGQTLAAAITNRVFQSRHVVVKQVEAPEEAKRCHLLFVSASELASLPKILEALGDSSVLTVSDGEGFARRGGVVTLTPDKTSKAKHFEISKSAQKKARLNFKNELLAFARPVP